MPDPTRADDASRNGTRVDPPEPCTATVRGGIPCTHPGWWACNACGAVRCGIHSGLTATGRECRNGPRQQHSNHRQRIPDVG